MKSRIVHLKNEFKYYKEEGRELIKLQGDFLAFKFSIKKESLQEDEMILIKSEPLPEVKCGVCGEKLTVKVYWFNGKMKRKICCDKCNAEVWK